MFFRFHGRWAGGRSSPSPPLDPSLLEPLRFRTTQFRRQLSSLLSHEYVLFPPQPCWERLVFITNYIFESSRQCRRFLISPSQTKSLLTIEYRLPTRLVHKYEYYSTTVCHRCRETLAALPVISGFIWLFPVTPAIAVNTVAVNKAIALDNVSEVVTFILKNSLFREHTRARMTSFYGVCWLQLRLRVS